MILKTNAALHMDYRVVLPLFSFQQHTSLHSVTYPLWTERLTNSTNHSPPWDENRRPGGKELTRLLRNPKVHCCIHNSPLVFPFTNRVSSVYSLRLCVFKIYFIIYRLILAYVLQVNCLHCFLKVFLNIYRMSHAWYKHRPPNLFWAFWQYSAKIWKLQRL